jgi:hypothetical protein
LRHKWENNIEMGFKETGWKGVDYIPVTHDRVQSWVLAKPTINVRIP